MLTFLVMLLGEQLRKTTAAFHLHLHRHPRATKPLLVVHRAGA
jgi:hypothetical protein